MENDHKLHTVLGANGAMGQALVLELKNRGLRHKLVTRNSSIHPQYEQADLLNKSEAIAAIKGSSFVYLCIGLPYSSKVWRDQWPVIMENTIEACSINKAKLIFFDNVYMYSNSLPNPFNEQTVQHPSTQKGKVRKQIADMLLDAIHSNKIEGLIARSADFYGPGAINSILYISLLKNMIDGKNPQSLSKENVLHTYAFIEDNAKAMLDLSSNEDCFGEVWHLPVSRPISYREIITIFNPLLNSNYQLKIMPNIMGSVLSFFIPIIKEAKEMQYQFDQTYIMSYDKFKNRFPEFKVTPIEKGLTHMVDSLDVS